MDIASAVVSAVPGRRDAVRAALLALSGVEIHAETSDGRFVVTVEDTAQTTAADTIIALHRLDGVLSAAMVYQYSDHQEAAG